MTSGSDPDEVGTNELAMVALDAAGDGVFCLDDAGRCLLINRAGAALLGYEPSEVVGAVLHELVHHSRADGSRYPVMECLICRACAAVSADVTTETWWRKDGRPLTVDATVRPVEAGAAGRGAVVVFRDVTARRDLERMRDRLVADLEEQNAALERITEELHSREGKFNALLRHSSDVSIVVDGDDEIVFVSPAVREMFGYEEVDLSSSEAFGKIVHPEDLDEVRTWYVARRAGIADTHAAEAGAERLCFRLRRADGLWRWVEARMRDLRNDPCVDGLVVNMRDVTTDLELSRRLHHQAHHDALTDLPNRTLLQQRIAAACRRAVQLRRPVAVLVIDLDGFKAVNDTLGHAAGDELIQAVAGRLGGAVREPWTVGRLGGDEFAVLVEDLPPDAAAGAAHAVADRILTALRAPLTVSGRHVQMSASIGVAVHSGRESVGELLRNADIAMYVAKAAGKGRCAVFEPGMYTTAMARAELESGLREAVAGGHLRLHYQPLRDLSTGDVTRYEALLRWQHPRRGLVYPAEFIDVAEATGAISELGDWVLEQVCADLTAWNRDRTYDRRGVAVNVSAQQLVPSWPAQLAAQLDAHDIDPADLTVEITESFLADSDPSALAVLRDLRDRGVRLAVDDFGTGYSSLARLRHLPASIVKIDRAFVADLPGDPQAAALVSSIIGLAHGLGLHVVAEGVETVEQWSYLRHSGCDEAQGYLLGQPQPVESFHRFPPSPQPGSPPRAARDNRRAGEELRDLMRAAPADMALERLVRPLLIQLQRLTGLESTFLARLDEENGQLEILHVWNTGRLHVDEGALLPTEDTICKMVLRRGPVTTTRAPVEFADSLLAVELGIHTYVGVPVRTPEGALFGTLCGVAAQPRPLSAWVTRLLDLFADVIGECLAPHRCI